MEILGIDIGGSAVKGAPVDPDSGRLLAERVRIATDKALTPLMMSRAVREIARHFKWRGPIGIGFPGVVREGVTLTSANLHPRFIGCDTRRLFAQATRCRVSLVNDADAAGLAEMRFGAGRRARGTVLLLTLGTGVGSALFYRGELYPNSELGHLPIKGESAEHFISAAARKRRGLSWAKWGRELGGYIRTLEKILSPELIIIGGGVSAKCEKFFKHVKHRVPMVPARFHNQAGIVGAALWAEVEQRLGRR
jgi:polyphosphate glucokinase